MNKRYSLKKNEDIAKLVHLKNSVGNKYYAIYYRISNNDAIPKIAISISKKFGKAVKRNYEKRVVREIIRPIINTLYNLELLIVIKKEVTALSFIEKATQINYLIRKINKCRS